MSAPESVLVVGASLGGLSVAEALRREGFAGKLVLLGAEAHLPYDRPPLSKKVLAGEWEPGKTQLRTEAALGGKRSGSSATLRSGSMQTNARCIPLRGERSARR
jgi:NADPH-dependent 2,4-dienoyl-CoA reductase/sulfur reductase-like enzyme